MSSRSTLAAISSSAIAFAEETTLAVSCDPEVNYRFVGDSKEKIQVWLELLGTLGGSAQSSRLNYINFARTRKNPNSPEGKSEKNKLFESMEQTRNGASKAWDLAQSNLSTLSRYFTEKSECSRHRGNLAESNRRRQISEFLEAKAKDVREINIDQTEVTSKPALISEIMGAIPFEAEPAR